MKLDFSKAGKYVLPVAGLLLGVASNIVNGKNQDAKLNELVEKKVTEALTNQAKGS